jgi:hypothetical protein
VGTSRERRAAKQRRRDERRGVPEGGPPAPRADVGRGRPAETLRRLLRRAGTDLAAGREEALAELRHVLAEHLARRRGEILAACDDVVADVEQPPGRGDRPDRADRADRPDDGGPAGDAHAVPPALLAALGRTGPPVSSWADAAGVSTEDAALATVRLLAATTR